MKIGVVSDIQYADTVTSDFAKHRKFRLSLGKLSEAIELFNSQKLNCIVNLGDTVDWGLENFEPVVRILRKSKHPVYNVLGNHDFYTNWPAEDDRIEKQKVLDVLGIKNNYYEVIIENYRLLFIDNNEVGIIEHPKGTKEFEEGLKLIENTKVQNLINAETWNGAISFKQQQWIYQQLKEADLNNQKVIFLAHAPIFPEHRENMINRDVILEMINKNRNIVAFLNGHNHDGNYGEYNGVACITFKGMVDTEENSFSIVTFTDDEILVEGYGREVSRNIKTRRV